MGSIIYPCIKCEYKFQVYRRDMLYRDMLQHTTNERVRRASLSQNFGFLYFCSTLTFDAEPHKNDHARAETLLHGRLQRDSNHFYEELRVQIYP